MGKYIQKVGDYRIEFFFKGFDGDPKANLDHKMSWIEKRFTDAIALEITSRLNYCLVNCEDGLYRMSLIIEKVPH